MVIGACVRHATLERNAEIAEGVPILSLAAPHIGHSQIRNRGTLGGSLAHADAAAEWPAVALAMDAEVLVPRHGEDARVIATHDLFLGTLTTSLKADDLITAVRFPRWGAHSAFAVEEFARRSGDFALAGVGAAFKWRVIGSCGEVAHSSRWGRPRYDWTVSNRS